MTGGSGVRFAIHVKTVFVVELRHGKVSVDYPDIETTARTTVGLDVARFPRRDADKDDRVKVVREANSTVAFRVRDEPPVGLTVRYAEVHAEDAAKRGLDSVKVEAGEHVGLIRGGSYFGPVRRCEEKRNLFWIGIFSAFA